jgi:hypothetical protein
MRRILIDLGVSKRMGAHDWRMARTWLYEALRNVTA